MATELKDYLSLKYDINIQDITPVKNVIRVSTDKGYKCLKRAKYDEGQFNFILSAVKHLLNKGFDMILPFIPTRDGELYVEMENGYGFLTEWVESRECNYSNPIELKMAAAALAKLHKASEGFSPREVPDVRMGWGRWIEKFSKRVNDMLMFKEIIKGRDSLTYFDTMYLNNADYFINQGIQAIKHLGKTKYFELMDREMKKQSFCHHDYANHNVLITGGFDVYIIDFDYCICDTRIHDLASLIIRNMRHGNWNMEKAQYITDCYLLEGSIVPDEIPVINAFLEFPQDFWQVGLQYYVEKLKWEEEHYNRRLERVINDKADRQVFLDQFKYMIEV
jgi:CotS family spore coat protein